MPHSLAHRKVSHLSPANSEWFFAMVFSRDATATLSARRKIGSSIETFVWRGESRGRLVMVKVMVKVM